MDEVDAAVGDSSEIGQVPDGVDNTAESTTGSLRRLVGPRRPQPRVRIELVLVDGPEGGQLRQLQADAVRAVLQWFADNHPTDPTI